MKQGFLFLVLPKLQAWVGTLPNFPFKNKKVNSKILSRKKLNNNLYDQKENYYILS